MSLDIDALEASVDSGSPRELYLFTQGAQEWAFTGADSTIAYSGRTYAKEPISRSQVTHTQEEASGGIEISLPLTNPVAQLFVGFQPTTTLYVTIFRLHRTGMAAVQFVGFISSFSTRDLLAKLACTPITGRLSRSIPSLAYQKQCNWPLYGAGCGVDKLAFRDTATVSQVDGTRIRSSTFASRVDGWYAGGWVELVSGARAGDRRYVRTHVGEELVLHAPFADLQPGEQVYAFAGCDRSETMCAAKFNNLPRHLGFARIPISNPYQGRMF